MTERTDEFGYGEQCHERAKREDECPAQGRGEHTGDLLLKTSGDGGQGTHLSPDQILRLIQAESGAHPPLSRFKDFNRNAFRIWSIVIILLGSAISLLILQFMLDQMPRPNRPPAANQQNK